MSSDLKDKVENIGKNIKATASAVVSDLKGIAKDTTKAAGDALDQAQKATKEALQKVEKKLS